MVIREADLDINIMEVPLIWTIQQNEIDSRQIKLSITEDGHVYTIPTGTKVILKMLRPDKKVVLKECVYDGHIIDIDFTKETTLFDGTAHCKISMVQNSNSEITDLKELLKTANYILDTVSFKIKIDKDNIDGYEIAE